MFIHFFYTLREVGIPVSPTAFLTLQRALGAGLITSLNDFYTASRSILVKSERYFDLYDRIFAHHFYGVEQEEDWEQELEESIRMLLDEWLRDPKELAEMLGIDPESLPDLSPEELVKYFLERLKEQTERHDGGTNGSAQGAPRLSAIPDPTREGCAWAGCHRANPPSRWPWSGATATTRRTPA